MAENDDKGNGADSLPAGGADQATSTMEKATDAADVNPTDQSGQEAADSQAADTSKDKGEGTTDTGTELPDKDTLPFDQHPKWQSARDAERRVQEILDKHGYDSIDDLEAAAQERNSLTEIIGNRDAKQIVDDYEEFQNVKKFWADQEASKREADEEPSETIARLKKEKQDVIDKQQREQADKAAVEESQRVLTEFDNTIRTTVSSISDLSDVDKSMLVEFMGVDNEIASVDPTNKAAVRQALDSGLKRFRDYLSDRDQRTIDDYVAGKSKITPVGASDTSAGAESVTTEEESTKGMTVNQFDAWAKDKLYEAITKAAEA